MKRGIPMSIAVLVGITSAAFSGTISGTVQATGMRDSANAVVYIEKIPGQTFPPPAEPVLMDQRGKEFLTKVLPVVAGTTVEFRNSDSFDHNVFTPDKCGGKFDLGAWANGESREHTFTEPCEAVMLCSLHPEMMAYVIVMDTPYFSVTDKDGSFMISDVPDGTYEVSVWHERLRKTTQSVSVSGDASVDFSLKR
jgi:hypothetical protein